MCDDCKDIAFESFVSLLQAADVDASYEDGNTGLSVDDISDKFSMSMQFNLGEKCQIKTNSGQIAEMNH
ncbi:MAG: hypothetical protein IPL95_16640 [Saprospiraceae bacterium]|nr:hypothetical protein [Saprospiraceae bacterium]